MNADKNIGANHEPGAISLGVTGALVTSLSLAFMDNTIAFMAGAARLGHIYFLFEPFLATFALALVGCLGLQVFLGAVIRPIFGLNGRGVAVAACAMVGAALAIHFLSPGLSREISPAGIVHMGLTGSVLALIGTAAYLANRVANEDMILARLFGAGFLGLPLLMFEASAYVWVQKYLIEGFSNIKFIVATLVAACALGATVFVMIKVKPRRTLKAGVFLLVAGAVAGPWVGMALEPEPGADREIPETAGHDPQHVILITVDTLRASALSSYGQEGSVPTPAIDGLAADGVLFQKAISSASWTLPSLTSIMSGIPPSSHLTQFIYSQAADSLQMMPEYFQQAGYYTAGFGDNPFLSPRFNVVQGFDEYQHFPNESYRHSFGLRVLAKFFPEKYRREITPTIETDRATQWLRENHERDFFLWVHYYDPHTTYAPPRRIFAAGSRAAARR